MAQVPYAIWLNSFSALTGACCCKWVRLYNCCWNKSNLIFYMFCYTSPFYYHNNCRIIFCWLNRWIQSVSIPVFPHMTTIHVWRNIHNQRQRSNQITDHSLFPPPSWERSWIRIYWQTWLSHSKVTHIWKTYMCTLCTHTYTQTISLCFVKVMTVLWKQTVQW